jgi:3-hydroxyisobutyrate dehydrogenase-like beta-hydroxyacid dehydrogenase
MRAIVRVTALLVLSAGGDPAVIERCRPALEPMGTIHFCGGLRAAMAIKLANNALACGTVTTLLEVRAVARACGADMEALMAVCLDDTANSFVVQAWDWIAADLKSLSPIGLKDVGLSRGRGGCQRSANPGDRSLSRQGLEANRRGSG